MDGTLEKPVRDTGAEGASESNLSGKRTEFLCFSDPRTVVSRCRQRAVIFVGVTPSGVTPISYFEKEENLYGKLRQDHRRSQRRTQ